MMILYSARRNAYRSVLPSWYLVFKLLLKTLVVVVVLLLPIVNIHFSFLTFPINSI